MKYIYTFEKLKFSFYFSAERQNLQRISAFIITIFLEFLMMKYVINICKRLYKIDTYL